MWTRCERHRVDAGSFVARIGSQAKISTWLGVATTTYLGKTAGATWVHRLGRVPPASMRAASLSHLKTWGGGCKDRSRSADRQPPDAAIAR